MVYTMPVKLENQKIKDGSTRHSKLKKNISTLSTQVLSFSMNTICIKLNHLSSFYTKQEKLLEKIAKEFTIRPEEDNTMLEPGLNFETKSRLFCDEVERISEMCQKEMLSFVSQVMDFSIRLMGQPPCQFAVAAMGSLAKCEVTPFSDLEYLFLIEEEEHLTYFERLAVVSYFTISNLGESNLKCFAVEELKGWFADQAKCGFEIDGFTEQAGNIPTGLGPGKNLFIKTVDQMVLYYSQVFLNPKNMAANQTSDLCKETSKDSCSIVERSQGTVPIEKLKDAQTDPQIFKKSPRSVRGADFSDMLSSTVFVYGEEKLHKTIRELISTIGVNNDRKEASLIMLQEDLKKFSSMPDDTLSQTKRVKKDFFRFPSVILYDFKIVFQIGCSSVWDVLRELKNTHISESLARSLYFIMCAAQYVRLDTYLFYRSQKDEISVLPALKTDTNLAYFPKELFLAMCAHLYPIKKCLSENNITLDSFKQVVDMNYQKISQASTCFFMNDFVNCLKNFNFFYSNVTSITDAEHLQMYIIALAKAGQLSRAYSYVKEEKLMALLQENIANLLKLYIIHKMGLYSQAKELYDIKAVLMNELEEKQTLILLYEISRDLGEYEKALKICERIMNLPTSSSDNTTHTQGMKLKAEMLGCQGKHFEAEELLEKCLEAEKHIYGDSSCHPEIAASYEKLGLTDYCLGRYKKALEKYDTALTICFSVYGDNACHPNIATLYNHIGSVWSGLGNYTNALQYHHKALKIQQSVYEDNACHPDIAISYYNMGTIFSHLGEYTKALDHYHDSIKILQSGYLGEGSHPCVISAYNGVGCLFSDLGEYTKALEYHHDTLEMLKLGYGEDACHPNIASLFNNIGNIYNDLGNYATALEYYNKASEMLQTVYGANKSHPDIGNSCNSIGSIYFKLGDVKKALEFYDKASEIFRSAYGRNACHSDIAISYNHLGIVHKHLGNHSKALEYYDKALEMEKLIYGAKAFHPSIAASYSNIGGLYKDLGNYSKALEYHDKALEMRKLLYGHNTCHPLIADSYNIIGSVFYAQGDCKRAQEYCYKALQMRKSVYVGNSCHPDIATSYNEIASFHNALGDYAKSLEYYNKALEFFQSVYGDNTCNPHIATSYNNIGLTYKALGEHRQALEYSQKSLEMRQLLYGDNALHPDIATSYGNSAVAYNALGDHAKALKYHHKALKILQSVYGDDACHPHIAACYDSIGIVHSASGKHSKALAYNQRALEVRQLVYGHNTPHPDIAVSYNNIGSIYQELGDHKKALKYFNKAVDILKSVYGNKTCHPYIASSYDNIGSVFSDLGDYTKALEHCRKALVIRKIVYGVDSCHPDIANSYYVTGCIYNKLGNHDKAVEYQQKAWDMIRCKCHNKWVQCKCKK